MTRPRRSRCGLSRAALALAVAALVPALPGEAAQRRAIAAGAMASTIYTCPESGTPGESDPRCSEAAPQAVVESRPYSEAEQQGAGCLVFGGLATVAAYAVNTDELLMIAAGGTLASGSGAVVALALLSTVAASGCAVGAIATPVLVRWYDDGSRYLADLQGQGWWPMPWHDRQVGESPAREGREPSWFEGLWGSSPGDQALPGDAPPGTTAPADPPPPGTTLK